MILDGRDEASPTHFFFVFCNKATLQQLNVKRGGVHFREQKFLV